jgi:hypothetical protein
MMSTLFSLAWLGLVAVMRTGLGRWRTTARWPRNQEGQRGGHISETGCAYAIITRFTENIRHRII